MNVTTVARRVGATAFHDFLHRRNSLYTSSTDAQVAQGPPPQRVRAAESSSAFKEYAVHPTVTPTATSAGRSRPPLLPPAALHPRHKGRSLPPPDCRSCAPGILGRLRKDMAARLHGRAALADLTTFRRAASIVKEVEAALVHKLHCLANHTEKQTGSDIPSGNDPLYSIESFLHERTGQLQRTLSALREAHYMAAAHSSVSPSSSPSQSGEGRSDVLQLIECETQLLYAFYLLPACTGRLVSAASVGSHVRRGGLYASLRHGIRVYAQHYDQEQQQRLPRHTSTRAPNGLWPLFWAALALPGDDAMEMSVATANIMQLSHHGTDPPTVPTGHLGAAAQCGIRVEAWCMLQWLHTVEHSCSGPGGGALTLSQHFRVIRAAMSSHTDVDAPFFDYNYSFMSLGLPDKRQQTTSQFLHVSNCHRASLRIPHALGRRYVEAMLHALRASPPDHTKGSTEIERLHVRQVALLCAAIMFYGIRSQEALEVLVSAAPHCAAYVELLSGRDISCLLLTYATLNYHGNLRRKHDNNSDHSQNANPNDYTRDPTENFYVILGTRAGQLGDTLRPEDISRVLRAFDLINFDAGVLRASLESSLRLRSVHRRTMCETE